MKVVPIVPPSPPPPALASCSCAPQQTNNRPVDLFGHLNSEQMERSPQGWTEGKETSSGWKDWEIKIVQITGSVGSLG